jgi:hypothetical protein
MIPVSPTVLADFRLCNEYSVCSLELINKYLAR